MHDLPCRRHAAHECDQLRARAERGQLHRMPFAAPRQRLGFPAGKVAARALLLLPSREKAEFDMPFHHRVNEGLIQCSDCHNPHGTVKPKQVRTSSSQDRFASRATRTSRGRLCSSISRVKVDGCQSCHLVHGGPNPHMLKLSNVNLLCLQCHTQSSFSGAPGAPSFHNQASFFQSCVCATRQIHGSNFDPTFL